MVEPVVRAYRLEPVTKGSDVSRQLTLALATKGLLVPDRVAPAFVHVVFPWSTGPPCRHFLSYSLQVVTREVQSSTSRHKGCYSHMCQAIWRRVVDRDGLQRLYRTNQVVRMYGRAHLYTCMLVGSGVASHYRGPIDNISCGPLSGLSQI